MSLATFGYAGKILSADLSTGRFSERSTMDYAEQFLGGRGLAAKIYWDEVPPEVGPFDSENRLIFATGPLGGLPVISGSRWTVCGKSPLPYPETFCYGNVGGTWGAELKFAGYDAIVVHGQAEKPVYVLIDDGRVALRDASGLWGKGSIQTREILKRTLGDSAKVVAIGPAGENLVVFATLLADHDSSGSGGLGAVMGGKRLKAIVVRGVGKRPEVARQGEFRELTDYCRQIRRLRVRASGTRYSPDPLGEMRKVPGTKKLRCYGCFSGECERFLYEAADGTRGKFMCHGATVYQRWAEDFYGEWNDVPFYATRLCNDYGLDSKDTDLTIGWLEACHKAGIISDKSTGIPISKLGSLEFIETFVKKVALREGIGDILANGLDRGGALMGGGAQTLARHDRLLGSEGSVPYSPILYPANALIYALEPRAPIPLIHEVGLVATKWVSWARRATTKGGPLSNESVRAIAKRFWGSEIAGDFTTYEGKALAAKMVQDRELAKECLILCDLLYPITALFDSENHVGDATLENRLLSAVIGKDVDERGLLKIGERVFNLQRSILVREGRSNRDCDRLDEHLHNEPFSYDYFNIYGQVPGRDSEIVTRVGQVFDRTGFEQMKSEYYGIRGWDVATGLPTRTKLEELGLTDVAHDLETRNLLGPSSARLDEDGSAGSGAPL